jgi:predicted polyphosphate/ATP-dependent NAD kinase
MRIGFLVNPIAGLGGKVALKGTDGMAEEALSRGAVPVAPDRARTFLDIASSSFMIEEVVTCGTPMGNALLTDAGIDPTVVHTPLGGRTTAEDTASAVSGMMAANVDIILFCGGDGTAVDVLSASGGDVPLLGIPAGVKMHSGIFAANPAAAAEVFIAWKEGRASLEEREVVDLDEEAFRDGRLSVSLFGYAKVPVVPELIQSTKQVYTAPSEEEAKGAIGDFLKEILGGHPDALVVLGPGSTVKAASSALGVEKTLLGVDLFRSGAIIARDVGEREILEHMSSADEVFIVVTPIGSQGFVFGRGNQQISADVIRDIPLDNILLISTPTKFRGIENLWVDTGDPEVDGYLSGYAKAIVGYHDFAMKKVVSGTGRR